MIRIDMVNLSMNSYFSWKYSYLKKDGIFFEKTIPIQLPSGETIEVGFHRGIIQSITYIFFHHAATFMRPYPSGSPAFLMQCLLL